MKTNAEYNDKLEKRYNDPGQVNSIDALHRHFTKSIPRKYIAEWLKKNPYQQISKTKYKSKDVTPFNVTDPGYAQIDLIYTKGLYPENTPSDTVIYQYLLVAVVLLTRKVFLYPIKSKTLEETKAAVIKFKKDYPPLKVIQSDNGTEFKFPKEWLAEHNLKSVKSSPYSPTSQAYVERMNQVVKNALYKYHQKTDSNVLVPEILEKTAESINDQPNRHTGIAPNEALTKENMKELIKVNKEKLEKVKESVKDDLLSVGQIVRVSLGKTNLTVKERNKYKTNKMWVPKFTTQLYELSKVRVKAEGYRAPTYELKAKKEGDEKILKGKRFLRRDLQPVDADTDAEWKPKVDLIKRAETTRGRGRPGVSQAILDARKAWGVVWMNAKNFTNRTGKFDLGKPGRLEELQKAEPKIKAMFETFIKNHTETPKLLQIQQKNFEKLKKRLAEGVTAKTKKPRKTQQTAA